MVYSFGFHIVLLISSGYFGLLTKKEPERPPIKVKFVQDKPEPKKKTPLLVDSPIPKKQEEPKFAELLSRANSRMHSNRSQKKGNEYKNNKTIVPKAQVAPVPYQPPAPPVEKKVIPKKSPPKQEKQPPKQEKQPLPVPPVVEERGWIEPEKAKDPIDSKEPDPFKKQEPKKPEKMMEVAKLPRPPVPPRPLTLLDGFDPEKYASLDTGALPGEEADDDEPISLDTRETKYVSYFTRIKKQIERVWVYPLSAARLGISGELTLRFKIARTGELLGIHVVDESGSEILDFAAIKAVKGAAPFYPIPHTIKKDKLTIMATFIYSPMYNTRSPLP